MATLIKDKYDWVKEILIKYPLLRDSNERLYWLYLKEIGYDVEVSFTQALKDMHHRVIPYVDSLGRASRKVQEDHPNLRGKFYNKRKKRQQEVKEEIKALTK